MSQNTHGVKMEYLVVDDNSSDDTRAVVEKYMGASPDIELKYIFEKKQGCNCARNTGIKRSSGEYLIFFDDDVLLEQGTLFAYVKAFQRYQDASVFGGKILLRQPDFDLPVWLVTEGQFARSMIVIIRNFGKENIRQDLNEFLAPVTLNMAVKRSVFEKYGYLRTDLGLSGKQLLPGADYEFFLRVSEHIESWIYVANAIAYHPLKKSQAEKSYFRRRLFGVGRITYRLHTFEASKRLFGLPLYFFTAIAKYILLTIKYMVLLRPVESFFYETEMILNCGCVYEHFVLKRSFRATENQKS